MPELIARRTARLRAIGHRSRQTCARPRLFLASRDDLFRRLKLSRSLLSAHLFKSLSRFAKLIRRCNHRRSPRIARKSCLISQRARRERQRAVHASVVCLSHTGQPLSVVAIVPTFVCKDRVILPRAEIDPRLITKAGIPRAIEVAKIVMSKSRPEKERVECKSNRDGKRRSERPTRIDPRSRRKIHRRVQESTSAECEVPISACKIVSLRRPDVSSRIPHESWPIIRPVTRPPAIAGRAVEPRTGNVEALVVRRRNAWTNV